MAIAMHALLQGLMEVCPPQDTLEDCMRKHALQGMLASDGPSQQQLVGACSAPQAARAATGIAGPPSAAVSGTGDSDSIDGHVSHRVTIAVMLLGLLLAGILASYKIDNAPPWLAQRLVKLLRLGPPEGRFPSGSHIHAPLSKLLTYHLDKQLSSTPSFKIWILGFVTFALISVGCLALYVAGEESLYSAFWCAKQQQHCSRERSNQPVGKASVCSAVGILSATH